MLTDYNSYQGAATDNNIAKYLQYKIGYITDGKAYGMCASVLNQCQDYTYDDGEYNYSNNVVKSYLERTLVQIKAQQDELLASYAESCITDVTSCLADNGWTMPEINYDLYGGGDISESDSYKVMQTLTSARIKACKNQVLTCMDLNHSDFFAEMGEDWYKMSDEMRMRYFLYYEVLGAIPDSVSIISELDCMKMSNAGEPVEWVGACVCVSGYNTEYSNGVLSCTEKTQAQIECESSTVGAYWYGSGCSCTNGYLGGTYEGKHICEKESEAYRKCQQSGGSMGYSFVNGKITYGACTCWDNKTFNSTTGKCE